MRPEDWRAELRLAEPSRCKAAKHCGRVDEIMRPIEAGKWAKAEAEG